MTAANLIMQIAKLITAFLRRMAMAIRGRKRARFAEIDDAAWREIVTAMKARAEANGRWNGSVRFPPLKPGD